MSRLIPDGFLTIRQAADRLAVVIEGMMFAILRGANGRRHEVDFNEESVIVKVSMSAAMVQIAMTAADPAIPPRASTSPRCACGEDGGGSRPSRPQRRTRAALRGQQGRRHAVSL
jgi:hypothetical protein